MRIHTLTQVQYFHTSMNELWDFCSNPQNINLMTPKDMEFKVLTTESGPIYSGQIIEYRIEVFPRCKLKWISQLHAVIKEAHHAQFIDEQKCGPYRMWHHLHRFEQESQRIKMTDLVHYILPFWPLGELTHKAFIHKRLQRAFHFRYEYLERKFQVERPRQAQNTA